MNKLGLKDPAKDGQDEKRQRWLDNALDVLQIKEAAEQTANPYFALMDPFKIYRICADDNGSGLIPAENVRKPQDALAYALIETGPAYGRADGRPARVLP